MDGMDGMDGTRWRWLVGIWEEGGGGGWGLGNGMGWECLVRSLYVGLR